MKKFSKDEIYEKLESVLFKFFDEDLNEIENFMVENKKDEEYYEMLDKLCERLKDEFGLENSFEICY